MRKLFYWAFAFSLCALMGCKDDGARVEVVRYAINRYSCRSPSFGIQ